MTNTTPAESLYLGLLTDYFECELHMDADYQITLDGNGVNAHEAYGAFASVEKQLQSSAASLGISDTRYQELREAASNKAMELMNNIYGPDWRDER